MPTIRKRGTRYEVQIRRKGFAPQVRTFSLMADAKEWARKVERDVDRRDLEPDRRVLQSLTLGDLVVRYRDTVVPLHKGGDKEKVILDAFLREKLCRKTLSQLTTSDFAEYRDRRLNKVAATTLKRQLGPIARMFTVAGNEWGIPLLSSPLSKLTVKASDNRRERRLASGEFERLVAAEAVNRKRLTIPIAMFALETAMRRGEILSLTWDRIDIEKRSATILEAKNGYSRVVPLTDAAMDVLRSQMPETLSPGQRVFATTENALRLSWQRLVRRAGIVNLHFHDLRHEAISRLFERGLTPPEVASISGHRTLSQLSRYAHASNAGVRAKLGLGTGEDQRGTPRASVEPHDRELAQPSEKPSPPEFLSNACSTPPAHSAQTFTLLLLRGLQPRLFPPM